MNFAKVGAEMSGEMRFPQQEQQVVHSSSESQRERERDRDKKTQIRPLRLFFFFPHCPARIYIQVELVI